MDYELLSRLFYKDSKGHENKYRQRFDSELSIKLPIYIHDNQVFLQLQ